MKKGIQILTLIVFSLILFPVINAIPPPQQNINTQVGLSIDFPLVESIKINESFVFNFHVFNISDGLRLDNSSVACIFHLYNTTGTHIIEEELDFVTEDNDWQITVKATNFSTVGLFSVQINCNDGSFGGFNVFGFEITKTGFILAESESLIYIPLLVGIFLIFLLSLSGAIVLPIKNKRNGLNEVIDVGFLKYAKVSLIFVTYLIFVWIINLLLTMTLNFNILSQFNGFFNMVFLILMAFSWPLFVIMLIVFFVMGANDLQLFKYLSRGLDIT